jgi:hypothetical protein
MKTQTLSMLLFAMSLAIPGIAQDTVPQLTDDNGSKIEFKRTDAAR